ncbi:hypothetical protein ILUMI_22939 [Ignelater luminosus]|uniref:Uncharacterized protein n=1 Tax=Ignelater luminosus TaxID=2038154 RepID=A0A8K0CBT6_IGNLU|nr:hypothetical protein ILUMI_22939 [Ignelater luminosus]
MNVLLITFFSVFSVVNSAVLQYRSVEVGFATVPAYYWRDFNGLIPNDAIKGGKDENGEDTYVAQFTTLAEYNVAKTKLHTVPAVIKKRSRYAFAPYAGRVIHSNSTTNTKILCTSIERYYMWLSPGSTFSPNCRFVIGGNEDGFPMFVGRAKHNKEVVVGKIFSDNTNHRTGLISAYNGIEVFHDTYEVLSHCPS